eukprot:9363092-Pyramimonas_sp.AAC.1
MAAHGLGSGSARLDSRQRDQRHRMGRTHRGPGTLPGTDNNLRSRFRGGVGEETAASKNGVL